MSSRLLASIALTALMGCAASPLPPDDLTGVRFGATMLPRGVARSNSDLAEDFLDLTFALESGEAIDGLLRYEGPVRIYLRSPQLAPYRVDLEALLDRLRTEAGLDIAETRNPGEAQIHIEAVSSREITRVFPSAACFIVPGETDWRGFLRRQPDARLRWSQQQTLRGAAIFLPLDTTPQDVRDCLNEEITQALGPANDLYRLPDTIWNDDNFHGFVTPFDMLMLRALYQPELVSGMTRAEVAAELPRVLDRVNPAGRRLAPQPRHPESRAWAGAIEGALSRDTPRGDRLGAARTATQIATEMTPPDHRQAVAMLTLGRLNLRRDPALAAAQFSRAYALTRGELGSEDIRTAQAGVHVAALALGTGQYETAVRLADLHVPTAIAGQNAILIAGLLSIQAEALVALGREDEARQARLDSLRWARYGFGDADGTLAREQAQIAALRRLEES